MPNLLKDLEIIEGVTSYIITMYDESAHLKIGTMNELNTTTKDNLVNAINELLVDIQNGDTELSNKIGTLTNLNTTDKSDIVNAINEVLVTLTNGDSALSNSINNIVTLINNKHIYNVRDYGAKGDGTTDDTTAIQDALTDCNSDKGILYFPSGTYVLNSELVLNTGITIMGTGNAKIKAGSNITLFSAYHTKNVKFINLILEGYSNSTKPVIDVAGIGEILDKCTIIGHGNSSILLRNHLNKITNCSVSNDGGTGCVAIECGVLNGDDGTNWTVNNSIINCDITSNSIGILVHKQTSAHLQEGLLVADCIILGKSDSNYGVSIEALFAGSFINNIIDQWGVSGVQYDPHDICANIKFSGNYLMGESVSVNLNGNSTHKIEYNVYDNNTIYSASAGGVFTNYTNGIMFSNNDFNCSNWAFDVGTYSKNVKFVDNVFKVINQLGIVNGGSKTIVKGNLANNLTINGTYTLDNPEYTFDESGHMTVTHTSGWNVMTKDNEILA